MIVFLFLVISSPYWEHIHEAWNLKNNPNMLFLFYEDLANVRLIIESNIIKYRKNFMNNIYNSYVF
jgi:hypothetical protein